MNLSLKNKSLGEYISLGAAAAFLAVMIFWIAYAAINAYFNAGTLIFMILAIACATVYVFVKFPGSNLLPLLAVIFAALAFAFFIHMSLPVWQDEISGFKMYGSRGTLGPVVALTVCFIVSIAVQIASCFMNRKEA